MPEIKHTPGPWLIDPVDNEYIVPASEPDSIGIAIVSTIVPMEEKKRWWFGPESLANAKLIAAAPDLLAAAIEVLNGLNARIDSAVEDRRPTPIFEGIAALNAAIAKATQ